jgi:hypothetical protein
MSDFLAFRPSQALYAHWGREYINVWAEGWTTNAFSVFIRRKQYFLIQEQNDNTKNGCRISQPDIYHGHFKWQEQLYRFFNSTYEISNLYMK